MAMARLNDAPTPYTPFDETRSALDGAQELASRVSALADRLVGAQPVATGANVVSKEPPTNSLFSSMRSHAQQTKDMIAGAMVALSNIESQLP